MFSVVIAVDHVVAGNQQASAPQLDADPRAGNDAVPVRAIHRGGDVDWAGPRRPAIVTVHRPHITDPAPGFCHFIVILELLGRGPNQQQPNGPGFAIHNGGGVV